MKKNIPQVRQSSQRRSRLARFEVLESRQLLSITLDPLSGVTLPLGAPVPVGLSGSTDAAGITYTVSTTNPALSAQVVNDGGRSLKLSVQNYGDMVFHLFEQDMPQTTARIIQLAQQGFYNGLTFHRVIKDFMIQGGDPTGTGTSGSGVSFDDQFNANYRFTNSGVLAMAKSLNDTNDSQFFVTAAPTQWLDFHHTIFGYLTKGASVLQAIDNVATDTNDKPTTPVTISSASVFNDTSDGVLMLNAAPGATGDADVTVTATNTSGESVQQTFHVTFTTNTTTEAPFLGPINPIETTAGQPVALQIPATDVQGHTIYYGGQAGTSNLSVNVGLNNGSTTVTPNAGAVGVGSVKLYASGTQSAIANPQFGYDVDSQTVPVYIKPAAPTVSLAAVSDTGTNNHDGITDLNNAPGKTLQFQINGAVAGAEIDLFADGQLIGQTTVPSAATSGSVVLETTPNQTPLADGVHHFTAQQTLKNQAVNVANLHTTTNLASVLSSAVAVTVDTQPQAPLRSEFIGNNPQAHQAGWTWKDPDGDTVMPVFSGPGYAELQFDDQNKLQSVGLHGTSKSTNLSLAVIRGGNGTVDIGSITADGAVGSLNLASVNLFGTEIELTGPAGMVFLHDVADNAKLNLGGQASDNLMFQAHQLGSGVDLTFGGRLTYAGVASWAGGKLDVAALGVLHATNGNLGANLHIDPAKNPSGGFGWIGVFGGSFTGGVDVPGSSGSVMVFGGDATMSLSAGGRMGPIMAFGGNVHFTSLNVASGGLNVMAFGRGGGGDSYQGGSIRIDGDNSVIHGTTLLGAYGGDLQLPAQMTIDGDVPWLHANRITSSTTGTKADLKVLGRVFAMTADWLSADIEVDSLVMARLARDNISPTSASGQDGSLHVKNRNGWAYGANGTFELANDSDGVLYTSSSS